VLGWTNILRGYKNNMTDTKVNALAMVIALGDCENQDAPTSF
jgi:hypothetical protein